MDLYFQKTGVGNPVIFLHGLFGSSVNWHGVARALAGRFTSYCPDLRNHGRSPHASVHDYEVMADDIYEFIRRHQLSRPFLVGHSMGGKVAMRFVLKYPGIVSGMVVVDISPRAYKSLTGYDPQAIELLNIVNALDDLHPETASSREELEQRLALAIGDRDMRNFLLKNVRRTPGGSFQWICNLKALKENLPVILDEVKGDGPARDMEVLFIKGGRSTYLSGSDIPLISKMFPNYRLEEIKEAGHFVPFDQPGKFTALINSFFS